MTTETERPLALKSNEGLGLVPERAAFEAWMDGLQFNLQRHPDRSEQYANTAVQGRWVSWQAAVAAERERFVRVCERLAWDFPGGANTAFEGWSLACGAIVAEVGGPNVRAERPGTAGEKL